MWRACAGRLKARLAGREERPHDDALAELARDLPESEARELARLIEVELGVPIGLLRADDRLAELLAPFPVGNPLTWLVAEGALEDATGEIGHRLARRRQSRGWTQDVPLQTFGDLFAAWSRP